LKKSAFLGIATLLTFAAGVWGQPVAAGQRQTALALEQQGRNAEAEEAWRSFARAHPTDAEPYAHLGLLEARQERYKEAVPLYRKALALNPSIPGLKLDLGLAQFKAGELKDAIQTFAPLRKLQPQDQRLTILIGMAHYGLGEYALAVPYLKEATGRDAQNLPLRLALAHSCLWSKQFQCVLDVYHEILTLNAESAEADMLAGEALDEMKDSAGAEQQFRAAAKVDPKEPNVHFGLAYLLMEQHRYDEAIAEFKAELANDPANYQAMTYLGHTYVQQNEFDQAKPILETAEANQASVSLTHLDLGIVYMETGEKDAALRELHQAVALDPDNVAAHFRLGRLYQSMRKRDEAKAEFAKASTLNQNKDEGLYKRIAAANGQPDPASSPSAKPPSPNKP
jgi:tetratricopeptide (TPR) repeat protein